MQLSFSLEMDRAIGPHLPFLQLLCTSNQKQRKTLLNIITQDQLRVLCELVLNIYYGNLPVSKHYIERLARQKKFIQVLVDRKFKNNHKKRLIVKNEGILPFLLKPLVFQELRWPVSSYCYPKKSTKH